MRAAWFEARDDEARHELAAQMQERAFETVPFVPLGQYRSRGAYRSYLTGAVDAPIAFQWGLEKQK